MMTETINQQALFDEHGRRVPFEGMRVYPQPGGVSRRYFTLIQPQVDFDKIYNRVVEHMQLGSLLPFSVGEFRTACEKLFEQLQSDNRVANITKGIHVPFICPPMFVSRVEDLRGFVEAAGRSFLASFPNGKFRNRAGEKGKPGDTLDLAPGSRYGQFESARQKGWVVGWYFVNCLSEYDIDSQRRQTESLPEQFVLSGGAEAAASLVGCTDLLINKDGYPHHLCLSALKDPDERYFYSFEAYGDRLLVFEYRTNVLTPTTKQLSEQFAGGLTVFTSL